MNRKIKGPHDTCPRCGSDDTFWNDSNADPDNDSACFYMYCEGCGKSYNSVFKPAYITWDDED